MDAQSANFAFLGRKRRVNIRLYGGVERLATVDDGKLQAYIIRGSLNGHVTASSSRVGVFHHVDHSLLYGHFDLHGDHLFESKSLAHLFDKSIQPWHFLRVVGQHDAFLHFNVALLSDILDGHHGQVVTLFGITHKLVDGLGHLGNELARLLLLLGKSLRGYIVDALHLELGMVGIHGLCQSIGKEEDGGACEYLRLLQGVLPRGHETNGYV